MEAALLGIIQGLTEFLPISSSGHLAIFQNLMKLQEPVLFFDLILHLGTLLATVIIFHQEILTVFKSPRALLLLITACIPTAIMGFFLVKTVEASFMSMPAVGIGLLITGTWLWFTRYVPAKSIAMDGFLFSDITFKKAFIIGVFQGIALFPGISRSGMTIASALFLRAGRRDAGTFSFLLSIPSVLGALLLKSFELSPSEALHLPNMVIGFFFSFSFGLVSLLFLVRLILKGHFYKFSYYCWPVGIAVLLATYLS